MSPYLTDAEVDDICGGRLVGPDVDCFQYSYGKGPSSGGIYFLWSRHDTLLYVGKTGCLWSRWLAHYKLNRIPFDAVSWIEIEDPRLRAIMESSYIEALDPPYNRQWERSASDVLVQRIVTLWQDAAREIAQC